MSNLTEKIKLASQSLRIEGYAIIRGFNSDDWQNVLDGLAKKLGSVKESQNFPKIMDIKPQPNGEPASSKGAATFPLHTDMSWHNHPAQVLAMFCIDPGQGGGDSLLSDGLAAFNALSKKDQKDLTTRLVEFPAPQHVIATGRTGYKSPVFETKGNLSVLRFHPKCLEDAPDDSPLKRFFRKTCENVTTTKLEAGTLVVCRNDRFLHGRTKIQHGLGTTRHLKRMDIHTPESSLG